jgi:glycosyltransferase involved in cell wall biosynthesis
MKRPVRILYEIHPHTVGGAERFLARFLAHLDRRKYEPLVIAGRDGNPLRLIASMGIRTIATDQYFTQRGIERIAEVIRRERIQLVQSNYYASSLALAASVAGVPHLWRLGGHVEVGSGVKNDIDRDLTLEMIGMLSRSVVCNSDYVRSQFARRTSARLRVIPNGIVLPPLRARRPPVPPYRIRMVAHLTPQKRHIDFIEAAELVTRHRRDVTFSILGTPYPDPASRRYAAEIRRRTKILRASGKLEISEFLLGEKDIWSDAYIVVLPSVRESFSNAILEAMAAGLPVIAAHSGGNPELVQHGRTGLLVPPEDPHALATAMLSLLDDPAAMTGMGKAGRERARRVFSMKACVERYDAEYQRVLTS